MANDNSAAEQPERGRKPWQRPVLVVYGSAADLTGNPDEVDAPLLASNNINNQVSDRNLKQHVEPVDAQAVLAKLTALPIATWNYFADDPGVRHMGPMAQDFAAAFGLGGDDRHIHVIDASGVALASLQALYELVQDQARQIALLRAEVDTRRRQDHDRCATVAAGGG